MEIPDDIILQVFHKVPSIDKMKWSVLARRFNGLWMFSNHLHIDLQGFTIWDHFCGFLDDLLARTDGGLALTALTINWPAALSWASLSSVARLQNLLTTFLLLPLASDLRISFPPSQERTFNPRVSSLFKPFINATVENVSIANMVVDGHGFLGGFQRLNSLNLEGIVFHSGLDPFGACVLLERLTLIKCAFKGDVHIRGDSMRVLIIRCPRTSPSYSTTVLTPGLSYLEFESPGITRFIFRFSMPFVRCIRIRGRRFEELQSILGHVQNLEVLDITWRTITWAVHNHIRVRLARLRILGIYGSGVNEWIPSTFVARCAGGNNVSIRFYSGKS